MPSAAASGYLQTLQTRAAEIVARMTLEEKAGQLNQGFVHADGLESLKERAREGRLGSVILACTPLAGSDAQKPVEAAEVDELQRIAVEESRLGIPLLVGRDVIHGCRTVFPLPLAQAASWDMELVEEAAQVSAVEACEQGVRWTFSPMVDVARDARWGRIVEGGGEDPFLTAALGAAMVRGYQGGTLEELASPGRLVACVKHFAGYGAAEGGRDYNTAEISDHTLRNIYLPPFNAALDAGALTVMSGFHDLNGQSASGSPYLLDRILRQEWGFQGFVISDWASVEQLMFHRLTANRKESARAAFNAGVEMDMCSDCFIDHVADLVREGAVAPERLDAAVTRILTVKLACGLFERPYARASGEPSKVFAPEHRALARRLAGRGMVLLKNEGGVLPLPKKGITIAVLGPFATQRRVLLGTWSLEGRAEETASILEAFREHAPEAEIVAASLPEDDTALAADRADVIVYCAGESYLRNGENGNVADIGLPDGQADQVRRLKLLGKPLVLVVNSGRPLTIPEAASGADAILYAWNSGTEHAAALCDLLFGDVNPSGKLPVGLLHHSGQIPLHYNRNSTGKPFPGHGLYRDYPSRPLYPFGHGLSYTAFAYDGLAVSRPEIGPGETVTVRVRVSNTGNRAGEEVVQCYLQDCVSGATRPVRELKGFQRIALEAGEARTIEFTLGGEELGYHGPEGQWIVEPGEFKVWVGPDSTAALETSFRLAGSGD